MAAVFRLSRVSGVPDREVKIFSLIKELFHFLNLVLHLYASVGHVGSERLQFDESFLELEGHFGLGLFLPAGLADVFERLLNLVDKALQVVVFPLKLLQTVGQFL